MNKGQNASHSKHGSQRLSNNINNGSREPVPAVESEANLKKRKREEPDASDPKLREFLQVMKTGREGVIAGDIAMEDAGGPSDVPAVAVSEEESDDEYEQIPTRREKQRRIDPPEPAQATISQQPHPVEAREASDPKSSLPEKVADSAETKPSDLEDAALDATDDDWLRSRTNRLLDLVDPDDLEPTTAEGPLEREAQTNGDTIKDTSHADESKQDDVAPAEVVEEPAENPAEDSLDAIRKTSRLFVRNLPYSATEDDLRAEFEKFGHLEEVSQEFLSFSCKGGDGNVMNPDRDSLYFGI